MKRLVFSVFAAAFAWSFAACEPHSVSELPPHYQHKLHGHASEDGDAKHDETHDAKAPHAKDEHAKPADAKPADPHAKQPAEGEKKPH